MVGFSAGAMLTMATALVGEDAKPAFIGNIYGPLAAVTSRPTLRPCSPHSPPTIPSSPMAASA